MPPAPIRTVEIALEAMAEESRLQRKTLGDVLDTLRKILYVDEKMGEDVHALRQSQNELRMKQRESDGKIRSLAEKVSNLEERVEQLTASRFGQ